MKHAKYLIIILLLFVSFNCKKQIAYTADVFGYIKLFDIEQGDSTYCTDLDNLNDHSGIEVILIKDKKNIFKTQTDKNGYFEFNNIPTGTYNIIYKKEGYDKFVMKSYQIIGGDNNSKIQIKHKKDYHFLRKIPKKVNFYNEDVIIKNDSMFFCGDADEEYPLIYFLLSTNPNITDSTFLDYYYCAGNENILTVEEYSLDYIHCFMDFEAGDTIYWQAVSTLHMGYISYNYEIGNYENNFITEPLPETGYRRAYGLSDNKSKINFVLIPDDYVSKKIDNFDLGKKNYIKIK